MLRLCPGWCSSSWFLFFVFLDFVFEFWTLYVSGEHTAAAHLRLCAAKSDCDPAQASSDFCYMSGLDIINKLLFFTFATESSFVNVTERSDHTMDSADASGLRDFLSNNNTRMDRQEEQMLATGRAVQALVAQVSELTTQFQHLSLPTAPSPPPIPSTSTS